ncbi:1-phosphatidylinositol-4,5-bisphosphate phosphodiesterase 1 [Rhizoctonia solani AG-1 IA]|uniref:Phosphoinositide phospholipase C n=1 Tax=Thanatephorus cucumeris (strain AG1-IA) TaxID=983506 RepID=L8X1H3_THACA|nr:1-phosphatidylinositol-4,5-bisphosphate phosphodiesterase 1 [Rhizoctonia solani AG-1 IA]
MAPDLPPLQLRRAEPLVSASGEPSPALPSTPPASHYNFLRTLPRRRSLRDKVNSGINKLLARAKSFTAPTPLTNTPTKAREFEELPSPSIKARDFAHRRTASDSVRSLPQLQTQRHDDDPSPSPSKRPPNLILTRSRGSSSTPRVPEENEDEDNDSEEVNSPKAYLPDIDPALASTSLFAMDEAGSSSCDSDPPASRQEHDEKPTYVSTSAQAEAQARADPVGPIVPAILVQGTPMYKVSPKTPKKTTIFGHQVDRHGGVVDQHRVFNHLLFHFGFSNTSFIPRLSTFPLISNDLSVDAHILPPRSNGSFSDSTQIKESSLGKATRQESVSGALISPTSLFVLGIRGFLGVRLFLPSLVQIENIKEIRTGQEARYYREQFKIPADREDRWMTIVYTSANKNKMLHTIAFSKDTMRLWSTTLDSLRELRQNIMSGIVSPAGFWEKHYWSGADISTDGKLEIEEVERLCRRLGIGCERSEVKEWFQVRSYLDGRDKAANCANRTQTRARLHARPEIKRLWNRMRGDRLFDLEVFAKFMKEEQMMEITDSELVRIFKKYATGGVELPTPPSELFVSESPTVSSPPSGFKPKTRSRSRSRSRSGSFSFAAKFKNAQPASPTVCSYPDKEPGAPILQSLTTPHFTLDDFSAFLLSADNSAFEDKEHDMTRPLSEYYISSSHNTYLLGHQLVGESTIEGYIRSLGAGCRSVEVDIWDGDHEPVITHGRTLTGSVPLRHVAQAIARYAFVASPYPVIISAEMHAGIEQQTMVAQILKEEFKDMLVTSRLDGSTDPEELEYLPSPEQLKHKVLVKFKNALLSEVEVEGEVEETDVGTTDTDSDLSRARTIAKRVRSSFRSNRRPDPADFSPPPTPSNTLTLDPMSAATPTSPPRKKQRAYSNRSELERPKLKMSRSLADLLVYTVGVKFRGLNKKEHYTVEQMFSLSEKTANKVLKENAMGLIKHCRTNLVRVYPNGTRVSSTNYEPARYWAAGVQLVAMNWQTIGASSFFFLSFVRGMELIKGIRFGKYDEPVDVFIISAQQIPRKRDENGREIIKDGLIDPLVEISLHAPDSSSTGPRTYRTTAIPNNGFNPIWEETVSIPFTCTADMWDLIFLRLAVFNDDDDEEPLAVYCSPLASLRKGMFNFVSGFTKSEELIWGCIRIPASPSTRPSVLAIFILLAIRTYIPPSGPYFSSTMSQLTDNIPALVREKIFLPVSIWAKVAPAPEANQPFEFQVDPTPPRCQDVTPRVVKLNPTSSRGSRTDEWGKVAYVKKPPSSTWDVKQTGSTKMAMALMGHLASATTESRPHMALSSRFEHFMAIDFDNWTSWKQGNHLVGQCNYSVLSGSTRTSFAGDALAASQCGLAIG